MRHLAKRSLRLAGHGTSIALEPAFWAVLEGEAARHGITLAALIGQQDAARATAEEPLASRLRVFALGVRSAEEPCRSGESPAPLAAVRSAEASCRSGESPAPLAAVRSAEAFLPEG